MIIELPPMCVISYAIRRASNSDDGDNDAAAFIELRANTHNELELAGETDDGDKNGAALHWDLNSFAVEECGEADQPRGERGEARREHRDGGAPFFRHIDGGFPLIFFDIGPENVFIL